MPVARETSYKPGETPGMWLNSIAFPAAGFHTLGRIFSLLVRKHWFGTQFLEIKAADLGHRDGTGTL